MDRSLKEIHWKTPLFWVGFSLLTQGLVGLSPWSGMHLHGEPLVWWPMYFLATWVHFDLGHGINNATMGVWLLWFWEKEFGFAKGFKFSLWLAIGLFIFEEVVHLWRPLPAACGTSAWLYAHLPIFLYLAYKEGLWKKWWGYLPFLYFILYEDILLTTYRGAWGESEFFHGLGFLFGLLGLALLRVRDFAFKAT